MPAIAVGVHATQDAEHFLKEQRFILSDDFAAAAMLRNVHALCTLASEQTSTRRGGIVL
jgi:hypothetical protein